MIKLFRQDKRETLTRILVAHPYKRYMQPHPLMGLPDDMNEMFIKDPNAFLLKIYFQNGPPSFVCPRGHSIDKAARFVKKKMKSYGRIMRHNNKKVKLRLNLVQHAEDSDSSSGLFYRNEELTDQEFYRFSMKLIKYISNIG